MAKIKTSVMCAGCGNSRLVDLSRSIKAKYEAAHPQCNKCSKQGLVNSGQFSKGQVSWNKGMERWWDNPGQIKKGEHRSPSTQFKKGQISPIKGSGKKRTCIVCGNVFFGANIKYCNRSCYFSFNRGENHLRWKGGITPEDRLERVRFRKKMQKQILARDSYTCQVCNQYGGHLQIDHIKGWAEYPELRFELDNCRTLCMACHYYVTFKKNLPRGVIWGHNLSKRVTS